MLIEITEDVKDVLRLGFELVKSQSENVPNYEDPVLTYERGKIKRAKLIETCILFVDIRNSTAISRSNPTDLLAKLYTAFVKSILNIAEYHNGAIRNIIGDRVMIVFPQKDCFKNAIDCAVSINTVSSYIINKQFEKIDFKCGIGIDYGEVKVIKAGIPKKEPERTNYKNLIWIGNTANIASKLTDIANKEIATKYFEVHYQNKFSLLSSFMASSTSKFSNLYRPKYSPSGFAKVSGDEFVKKFTVDETGNQLYEGCKIEKLKSLENKVTTFAILMSQEVYEGILRSHPENTYITNGLIKKQEGVKLKDYNRDIFGGNIKWSIIDELK